MMNRFFLTALFFVVCLPVSGAEEVGSSAASFRPWYQPRTYLRVGMVSSKSGRRNTMRTLKSSGADESGGMSERTALPNLTYLSGMAILGFGERSQMILAASQSMDSAEERIVATPFGTPFVLPGQVAAARFRQIFSPAFSLDAGIVYIDTFKLLDPSVGGAYRYRNAGGLGVDQALMLTAPLTEKSKEKNLLTKATARSALTYRSGQWMHSLSFAHSRPFYGKETSPAPGPVSPVPNGGKSFSSGNRLEEIDIVMSEAEKSRTTAGIGTNFMASNKVRLSASLGASYLRTARNKIWMSSCKPVSITYAQKSWEVGGDLSLSSSIEKYGSLTLPKNWNVGVRLAYFFGENPMAGI